MNVWSHMRLLIGCLWGITLILSSWFCLQSEETNTRFPERNIYLSDKRIHEFTKTALPTGVPWKPLESLSEQTHRKLTSIKRPLLNSHPISLLPSRPTYRKISNNHQKALDYYTPRKYINACAHTDTHTHTEIEKQRQTYDQRYLEPHMQAHILRHIDKNNLNTCASIQTNTQAQTHKQTEAQIQTLMQRHRRTHTLRIHTSSIHQSSMGHRLTGTGEAGNCWGAKIYGAPLRILAV